MAPPALGRMRWGSQCGNRRTMSVAPPSLPLSGADQYGVRVYNERLVLSLVRRFGQLSKIEVARMTGLSVQSTSTIMNRLSGEGLLKREPPCAVASANRRCRCRSIPRARSPSA